MSIIKITNQIDWNIKLAEESGCNNVCFGLDGIYKPIDFNKEYIEMITKSNLTTLERIQYNKITRLWKQLKSHVVTLVNK